MKLYLKQNVYDAALDRIRWLFDEFPNVIVNVSGGKDSTVVYELAMKVAIEKGRLPLTVLFVDQEIEFQSTIDTVKKIMHDPRVKPMWLQIPFVLSNATSQSDTWLRCWAPGEEWMREKDPVAITENRFGTERFKELFAAVLKTDYKDKKVVNIAGVRGEESPGRLLGLTNSLTYKHASWGKKLNGKKSDHYNMYPIFDWSYTDVWTAIERYQWDYNPIYDAQYRYGIPLNDMRVSSLCHETSIKHLYYLQEVEPDTYVKATKRLSGIDTAGKLNIADFMPKTLPFMFDSWRDYRDHLLETMVANPDWLPKFKRTFKSMDYLDGWMPDKKIYRTQCMAILTNDHEGVKCGDFMAGRDVFKIRKHARAAQAERIRAEEEQDGREAAK